MHLCYRDVLLFHLTEKVMVIVISWIREWVSQVEYVVGLVPPAAAKGLWLNAVFPAHNLLVKVGGVDETWL